MNSVNTTALDMWSSRLVGLYIQRNKCKSLNVSADKIFYEKDLPDPYRILKPDSIATMDFRFDRLNVNTDFDYKVKFVNYG
ncbi:hypothetical protein AYI69_g2050 [Smittium culicis]|uniref:Uncharacterized protein n=1 Tax=Smittium culicis TaxID=133412 RepID=A0A1R1YNJ6_9FUNG|nr:hypothetical protein AYI69_g10161 [Smittium culicis]OMJ24189.1 hypothetical protein AYI69_g4717 [Smittium culicis]OMJ28481.1 hypothetical protein AYI69_g2050 [Smittium culicis]